MKNCKMLWYILLDVVCVIKTRRKDEGNIFCHSNIHQALKVRSQGLAWRGDRWGWACPTGSMAEEIVMCFCPELSLPFGHTRSNIPLTFLLQICNLQFTICIFVCVCKFMCISMTIWVWLCVYVWVLFYSRYFIKKRKLAIERNFEIIKMQHFADDDVDNNNNNNKKNMTKMKKCQGDQKPSSVVIWMRELLKDMPSEIRTSKHHVM